MTLPAHCRTIFLGLVAALTIGVKGFHQRRFSTGRHKLMAIRAALIFGGFILHQATVIIIYMMAGIAFFNLGEFVVLIMPEDGTRTPGIFKYVVVDKHHVLL